MKLLIVTFNLQNGQKDYEPLIVALRGNVIQWWHFIPQTCIVASSYSPDELTARLIPHIDRNSDFVLVAEIQPHQFQGWLPKAAWDWLIQVSQTVDSSKQLPPGSLG